MSFELTINGKTQTFETAAEMLAWRERMQPVVPKRRKKFKKNDRKTNNQDRGMKGESSGR